ncbi:alpha-L-fucosidase [Maribellus mangrovi]|uniref:alpha-L-fucosidase n=1 Tax=Maribellus mangrovi TaxID=3133146 RepID=UPI0030EEC788
MKKSYNFIIILLLVLFSANSFAQIAEDAEASSGNRNKPEKLEWLKDAGFGMFIHFGMDSQLGVVISHSLVGASDDYKNRFFNELPKTFNPSEFDAYKIATLAKLAGMKYIVFTTKHHSGFCMWNTKTTDFNIMNTPYGKDLLKEYVEGVRKAGLKVGLYYSPEDFLFMEKHGMEIRRKKQVFTDEQKAAFDDYVTRQCTELMTNYGPIDVMFIDGKPKDVAKKVFWDLQPDLLITRGAISTPEQKLSSVASDKPWESCVTLGTQWQYKPYDDELKTPGQVIKMLIEVRSKGGSLLMNLGPRPDGSMSITEEDYLRNIAAWYFVNHEAVDSVRPWIVTNEDNIWFSKKKDKNTVYAYITDMPNWKRGSRKSFVIGSVEATRDTKISVLGHNGRVSEYQPDNDPTPRFEQTENGLKISVERAQRMYNNAKWPNPIVVKLENVKPSCVPPVVKTVDVKEVNGEMIVTGKLVDNGGSNNLMAGVEYKEDAGFVEDLYHTEWGRTDFIPVNKEGNFEIKVPGLAKGASYQFKAIVKHPKLVVKGEMISSYYK